MPTKAPQKPVAQTKPLTQPAKVPIQQQKAASEDEDDYEDDDYEDDDFDEEEEELFKKTANEFATKLKEL